MKMTGPHDIATYLHDLADTLSAGIDQAEIHNQTTVHLPIEAAKGLIRDLVLISREVSQWPSSASS